MCRLFTYYATTCFTISKIKHIVVVVFLSCFRSSRLRFLSYIRCLHVPQYAFFISLHHMSVTFQSSLRYLVGCLRHSCCPSDAFFICPHHMSVTFQSSLRYLVGCLRHSSCPSDAFFICPHHMSVTFQSSLRYVVGCLRHSCCPSDAFFICPHHMSVTFQSTLRYLVGCLRHSCCPSDMFVPDFFSLHAAHPPYSILISFASIRFSCRFVVGSLTSPLFCRLPPSVSLVSLRRTISRCISSKVSNLPPLAL